MSRTVSITWKVIPLVMRVVRREHRGAGRYDELEGIANLHPLEGLRRQLEDEYPARLGHHLHPVRCPIDRSEVARTVPSALRPWISTIDCAGMTAVTTFPS